MLGIELDKMLVVVVLVGVIAGPQRLLMWSRSAIHWLRRARVMYRDGKNQIARELDEMAPDWREMDPRKLHPKRMLHEVLEAEPPVSSAASAAASNEVERDDRADGSGPRPAV